MTEEFKPKISYRIAGTCIHKPTTPWEYLEDWAMSDRDLTTTLDMIADRMKLRWPGNYRVVVKEVRHPEHMHKYSKWCLEFDNPGEETLFRLRWA